MFEMIVFIEKNFRGGNLSGVEKGKFIRGKPGQANSWPVPTTLNYWVLALAG